MHRLNLLPTLLVIIYISYLSQQQEQIGGPYRVFLRQLGQCDDEGTRQVYVERTRINKISRNKYTYSSKAKVKIYLNDSVAAKVDIAKFGNGGWRPHFLEIEGPRFCTDMYKILPGYFNAILRAIGTECPIPVGDYYVNDLDLDEFHSSPVLKVFPYGKFRADYSWHLNGTLIGCIRHIVDIVPVKGRKNKH